MIKQFIACAFMAAVGIGAVSAFTQFPVSPSQTCCPPNVGAEASADMVAITFRDFAVVSGPGTAGTFVPLPGNVAVVPGGNTISDGNVLVITDVRITFTDAVIDVELREQSQTLSVNRLLLTEDSMVDGWQSDTGVTFTGDETVATGLVFAKRNAADSDALIDIELIGYVTTK